MHKLILKLKALYVFALVWCTYKNLLVVQYKDSCVWGASAIRETLTDIGHKVAAIMATNKNKGRYW